MTLTPFAFLAYRNGLCVFLSAGCCPEDLAGFTKLQDQLELPLGKLMEVNGKTPGLHAVRFRVVESEDALELAILDDVRCGLPRELSDKALRAIGASPIWDLNNRN